MNYLDIETKFLTQQNRTFEVTRKMLINKQK